MIAKTILIALLIVSASAWSTTDDQILKNPVTDFPCMGYIGKELSFFIFNNLKNNSFRYNIESYTDAYNNSISGEAIFTLCGSNVNDTVCTGLGSDKSIGYLKLLNTSTNTTTCVPLSNPKGPNNWTLNKQEQGSWRAVGYKTNQTEYTTTVNLLCGTGNEFGSASAKLDEVSKTITLTGSSSNFCAHSGDRYFSMFVNHWIFPATMIPLAIFLLFFGIKFVKTVLFIIGLLLGSLTTFGVAALLKDPVLWTSQVTYQIAGGALLAGLVLGFVFTKLTKLTLMITGGFLGYVVGMKVFEIFTLSFTRNYPIAQIAIIVVLVIIGVVVGYYSHDHVLILGTAFGGSFLLCLTVGFLLKNYPDINNLPNYQTVKNDEAARRIFNMFVLYTLLWLCIGSLGAFVQYKNRKTGDGVESTEEQPQDTYTSFEAKNNQYKYDAGYV